MYSNSNKKLAFSLLSLLISMILLSFASVPLYNLFCKISGYGGTTREARHSTMNLPIGSKKIILEFDANIASDLPWRFFPLQRKISLFSGQTILAFYESENLSNQDIIGTSIYNITPHKAGKYFVKIHCFCFEEQLLKAREKVIMPVTFYIDPEFEKDPEMEDVQIVTLSYSFFKVRELNSQK